MLNDFTWNMTGYIPKHQVNPHGDGIIPYVAERIFQLEPEPPSVGNLNEYILSALHEKNLLHFSFFLHHYEPQLNKRIKSFLGVDGGDLYDTDRFLDIKLSCREQMLQKLIVYDPAKGAEYATYIYPFIRDAMLRFRMGEEKWSVSSLTNYKMVRSMAWLYHNTKDAVNEFSKKYNCDLALAEEYLKVVRGIRNQQPFYVTDDDGEETGEDVALDDTWNYADILWNGIQAEKVRRAYLLISTPFLHNQKFIFLFYISAKDKYTANNFRDETANIFHSPSSCNTLVHNTKNLRIVGVYQRIILAIVHGQKIFFAVHNNIGMVNSWHSANWPTHHIGIITICISGASRTD